VWPSFHAAEKARRQGIKTGVINLRFIKPLDRQLLYSALSRVERVLTVEENVLQGGMGSALLEFMQEEGIRDKMVRRLGIGDEFAEHGSQLILREKYLLDEEGIYRAIMEMNRGQNRTKGASRQVAVS